MPKFSAAIIGVSSLCKCFVLLLFWSVVQAEPVVLILGDSLSAGYGIDNGQSLAEFAAIALGRRRLSTSRG